MNPSEKKVIVVGGASGALAAAAAKVLAGQGAQAAVARPSYPTGEPPMPHPEGKGGRAARQRAKTLAKKAKRREARS